MWKFGQRSHDGLDYRQVEIHVQLSQLAIRSRAGFKTLLLVKDPGAAGSVNVLDQMLAVIS
jgi:hypothetical protein